MEERGVSSTRGEESLVPSSSQRLRVIICWILLNWRHRLQRKFTLSRNLTILFVETLT